jgi:hypothetical protein
MSNLEFITFLNYSQAFVFIFEQFNQIKPNQTKFTKHSYPTNVLT